jgi:steroid Delta-isomerase
MSESESRAHIARFNAAVTSGDWTHFMATFAPDAVMTFDGPPVGPFIGREAIAEAYQTNPPTETMETLSVRETDGVDHLRFRWSSGATGTVTIHRRNALITHLAIAFDA